MKDGSLSSKSHSSIELPVEGMVYEKSADTIISALKEMSGVLECRVDCKEKKVTVLFDSHINHGDAFIKKLESLGYNVPLFVSNQKIHGCPDFAASLHIAEKEAADVITEDPVCGMLVKKTPYSVTSTYEGNTYYFCDPPCKKIFDSNTATYISSPKGAS